jgi:4-hydroxy-2-oxoheptanedioate aldolase
MDISKREFLAAGLGVGLGAGLASDASAQPTPEAGAAVGRGGIPVGDVDVQGAGRGAWQNSGKQPSSVDMNYKPRRINKVIELWEDGQPAYFTNSGLRPGMDAYAQGKKMAGTFADLIFYGAEHAPLDFTDLANFMCGLKDGGPTKSGHVMPAVVVEVPCVGLNEQYALANSWIVGNVLDLGAMGVVIDHARDPMAMEVYCQIAARYSFDDHPNTATVPRQGLGLRTQEAYIAATLWGISVYKYLNIADVWPLNPRGEIMIGCKIDDKLVDANMEKVLATQGLAFAQWGVNTQSVLGLGAFPEDHPGGRIQRTAEQTATLNAIADKVRAECKKNNLKFIGGANEIKNGAMLLTGGEPGAVAGRELTKRKMPV